MEDRTWEIMTRHLESDVYDMSAAGEDAPSREMMSAFAREVGCAIPEEFIAHSCGRFGGLCVEVKEALWPRAKPFDVGPSWSFCYGLYTFTLAPNAPDFMALRDQTLRFRERSAHSIVPCLKIFSDPDIYGFASSGELCRWDHEQDILAPYAGSFFDLLDEELAALAQRKNQKVTP